MPVNRGYKTEAGINAIVFVKFTAIFLATIAGTESSKAPAFVNAVYISPTNFKSGNTFVILIFSCMLQIPVYA